MRLALEKRDPLLQPGVRSRAGAPEPGRRQHGQKARVSVRVNPDIDAGTHPYISTGLKQNKFGIPIEQAPAIYRRRRPWPTSRSGVDCHIGSQLTELNPFMQAADKLLKLIDELAAEGIHIHHLDVGGGLGSTTAPSSRRTPPSMPRRSSRSWRAGSDPLVRTGPRHRRQRRRAADPGRVPQTRRDRNFALIDAGMNDLLRPPLRRLDEHHRGGTAGRPTRRRSYDVVGR